VKRRARWRRGTVKGEGGGRGLHSRLTNGRLALQWAAVVGYGGGGSKVRVFIN